MENMGQETSRGRFAVIVPARNAAATLPSCLRAIMDSTRKPDELILFDDGLTPNILDIAKDYGARVISNQGTRAGAARGRNLASRESTADIFVFVDADVIAEKDALRRLLVELESDPQIVATFGSYDQYPRVQRQAALYVNLRHHWIHQQGDREATTFWTGLGAVRADTFRSLGGFNEQSGIEDVDLGLRLRAAGKRVRLVPEAQGTHCKDWSLLQLWRTDIADRAFPWSLLLAHRKSDAGQLNTAVKERLSAAVAHLSWILLLGSLISSWFAIDAMAAVGVYIYLNRGLFRLFLRMGGFELAFTGACLHWLYHLYASATYVSVFALIRARRYYLRLARALSIGREGWKT